MCSTEQLEYEYNLEQQQEEKITRICNSCGEYFEAISIRCCDGDSCGCKGQPFTEEEVCPDCELLGAPDAEVFYCVSYDDADFLSHLG